MRNRPIVRLGDEDAALAKQIVLHEDAHMLALNKPAGLPCQTRNAGDRSLDHFLWAFARSNGKRPYLVHRLDQQTSGVIVAARTKPAAVVLHGAFERRDVTKTYLALVSARGEDASNGRIDAPITDQRAGRLVRSAVASSPQDDGARKAVTRWKTLARQEGVALLRVQPETGRMHQIRVHLAHSGIPILGDYQYGDGAAPGALRTMLHAASIDVPHPSGGRAVFHAPPPVDFLEACERFGFGRSLEALP